MTLIQTFELARDFSPIYVNLKTIADVCRDICNSFQYIKTHTHISTKWIKYACVHDNCMTV